MSEQSVEDVTSESVDDMFGGAPDLDVDPPDNPLIEGSTEYSVRLVYRVNADNPEHARTRFIAILNEFGLNNWTYRVTEVDTDTDWLVNDGVVLTPEQFEETLSNVDDDA